MFQDSSISILIPEMQISTSGFPDQVSPFSDQEIPFPYQNSRFLIRKSLFLIGIPFS